MRIYYVVTFRSFPRREVYSPILEKLLLGLCRTKADKRPDRNIFISEMYPTLGFCTYTVRILCA